MMLYGLAAAVLLAGCSASGSAEAADLVRTRCTRCHNTTRIKESAAKDRAYWETTVERMRSRGARIDETEREVVLEFLASGGAADL